jgi:site-specific recombinase XerD
VLVRNNISLESIKELLGHSSVIVTEQSYANNEHSRLHRDVDSLDSILSEIKTQNQ